MTKLQNTNFFKYVLDDLLIFYEEIPLPIVPYNTKTLKNFVIEKLKYTKCTCIHYHDEYCKRYIIDDLYENCCIITTITEFLEKYHIPENDIPDFKDSIDEHFKKCKMTSGNKYLIYDGNEYGLVEDPNDNRICYGYVPNAKIYKSFLKNEKTKIINILENIFFGVRIPKIY